MAADTFPTRSHAVPDLNGSAGSPLSEGEKLSAMLQKQRMVWHILAAVAVVEMLVGGWLVGLTQQAVR